MAVVIEVYDGAFRRVAQLATASQITRAYSLGQRDSARWVVNRSEAALVDPREGSIVAIVSDDAPLWVGGVERLIGSGDGQCRVEARSYDAILDARYLPDDAKYSAGAGQAFRGIVSSSGATNPHGIGIGGVADGAARFEAALPRSSARRALDLLAGVADREWWVTGEARDGALTMTAHLGARRGRNRYAEVALTHGAGVDVSGWVIDGRAAAWAVTVVGGTSSPIQAVADRSASREVAGPGDLTHGWEAETPSGSTVLTRRERLMVVEELRDAGRTQEAARVAAGRPPIAIRRVTCTVASRTLWGSLGIGDTIRVVAPEATISGLDAAARVTGMEIDEDAGLMSLVLEIRRDR